jgi:vacuolar-type H+-ATPase subunit I/STV1
MENKIYVYLDESNSYAKYLGLTVRFSVYWRSSELNDKNASIGLQKKNSTAVQDETQRLPLSTLHGAGARIEKMMIEVMEARGEATKIISVDNFLKEHERLQLEVRRRRNLMSTEQRVQEDKDEKAKAKFVNSRRKGVVDKQEALLQHLEKMKEQKNEKSTINKDSKARRREIEEKVSKIIENTAKVTKTLQAQLHELQSRGWNEFCI